MDQLGVFLEGPIGVFTAGWTVADGANGRGVGPKTPSNHRHLRETVGHNTQREDSHGGRITYGVRVHMRVVPSRVAGNSHAASI